MSRPLRIEYLGAWYHVMNRGRRREPVFLSPKDYATFITVLKEASNHWNLRIAAYCLMTNHYHLLVQTPDGNLSRCMRHINGVYTQRFNREHNFDGQLFRGRYKAVLVAEDNHLLEVLRYIHRNPLGARVVKSLGAYDWSSHHGYLSTANSWQWLEKDFLLGMLATRKSRQMDAYRTFVSKGNTEEIETFYSLKNLPTILGGKSFADWVKATFRQAGEYRESPTSRQFTPSAEEIFTLIRNYFQVEQAQLLHSRRGRENMARDLSIYLVRRITRDTLTAVGRHFGISSYSTVSSAVERARRRIRKDRQWRKLSRPIACKLSSKNYSSFIILIVLSSRHERKKRFMGFC